MFRSREVIIRLALEHFKKEYTDFIYWKRYLILYTILSQLLQFFYIFSKFLNGWKYEKIKCLRLLKLEVSVVTEVCGVVDVYHVPFYGVLCTV